MAFTHYFTKDGKSMKKFKQSRMLQTIALLAGFFLWLANSGNPPNGRTGAPFDGSCNNCHGGGGTLNGTVEVTGLPTTIEPSTTYPLTITMTPTGGNPVRAGYQLVVVDGNNANAGDLATINSQSGVEFFGGREYIEQRSPKTFTGGAPVSWSFNWTSPATANGNTIKFYYTGNFVNGNGGTSGDIAYEFEQTVPFAAQAPLTASISEVENVSCNGGNDGSATVVAAGGTPPYTYLWSNGQTTATAVNLAAGNYSVTVTGAGGAGAAVAAATVTQPSAISVSTNVSGVLSCTNVQVTATAAASGGSGGYSYVWSDNQTGSSVQFAQPGTYTVTVTDVNNCSRTGSVVVVENITPPVAAASPSAAISCVQPTVVLSGAGSSSGQGISYLWTASNGGSIVAGANTLTPTVNAAGTYTLQVLNSANGCVASAATVVSSQVQLPSVSVTNAQLSCANPTASLQAATNASAAAFSWSGPNGFSSSLPNPTVSGPGTYSLTVTNTDNGCTNTASATVTADFNLPTISLGSAVLTCTDTLVQLQSVTNVSNATYNWSGPDGFSAQVAAPFVSLPGTYEITVTNTTNGCTASASLVVAQDVAPPVVVIGQPDNLNCVRTSVQLDATASSQGTDFVYSWTTVDGNLLSGAAGPSPVVDAAGTYLLTIVNNNNGCATAASATVIAVPAVMINSAVASPLNCFEGQDGQITAAASGGSGSLSYLWSNGQTTATVSGLAAGLYQLLVTDADGCADSLSVMVDQPALLSISISATPESAVGANDAYALASVSGGTPGYTYLWTTGAATDSIGGLAPGTYGLTVTDANGCSSSSAATINAPNCTLAAVASATPALCAGAANGTASVVVNDNSLSVNYLWSNGATTASISGLVAGTYVVTVSDDNNCQVVASVVVTAPSPLLMSLTAVPASCPELADGQVLASTSGGTPPYSLSWPGGGNGQGLGVGSYALTLTDGNGCSVVDSVVVTAQDNIAPQIVCPTTILACAGESVAYDAPQVSDNCSLAGAQAVLLAGQPSGGSFPAGETVQLFEITDASGNIARCSFTVRVSPAIEIVVLSVANDVDSSGTGNIQMQVSGGLGTLQYSWTRDDQAVADTEDIGNLLPGTYVLTVIDENGCSQRSAPIIIDNIVAVGEPTAGMWLQVQPNPADQYISLQAKGADIRAVSLLDGAGRQLRNLLPEEWQAPLPVGTLLPGLYFFRVVDEQQRVFFIRWIKS